MERTPGKETRAVDELIRRFGLALDATPNMGERRYGWFANKQAHESIEVTESIGVQASRDAHIRNQIPQNMGILVYEIEFNQTGYQEPVESVTVGKLKHGLFIDRNKKLCNVSEKYLLALFGRSLLRQAIYEVEPGESAVDHLAFLEEIYNIPKVDVPLIPSYTLQGDEDITFKKLDKFDIKKIGSLLTAIENGEFVLDPTSEFPYEY
jgi:hypothetical protein